jgi:hypothetical protein
MAWRGERRREGCFGLQVKVAGEGTRREHVQATSGQSTNSRQSDKLS